MALSKITNASVADTAVHGRRNLIINGAMQVAQRGTSKTGLTSSADVHTIDRWRFHCNTSGTFTVSQSTEAPNGFSNSYKVDCTASDSSPDYVNFSQRMEGQNVQHLKKGTSDAVATTVSFYVRSSKTGTYQVTLADEDNNRIVGKTYTIDVADTWEYKTLTFPADTSGALGNDNGNSLQIEWWLAAGSTFSGGSVPTSWEAKDNTDRAAGLTVDIGASTSDDWYITGVQLEVGDKSTPFEHRSYGEELALCYRYFYKTLSPIWFYVLNGPTEYGRISYSFPTTMRATPTSSVTIGGGHGVSGSQYMSAQNIGLYVNTPTQPCSMNTGATFDAEL